MCGEELSLAKARMSDGVVDLFQLEAQNLTAIKKYYLHTNRNQQSQVTFPVKF